MSDGFSAKKNLQAVVDSIVRGDKPSPDLLDAARRAIKRMSSAEKPTDQSKALDRAANAKPVEKPFGHAEMPND